MKALAIANYGVRVGSLFTPLYDPLWAGHDDSWVLLVLLAAAHLGLGVVVARRWALVFPVAIAGLALAVGLPEGVAGLALVFGLPVLSALTFAGWALASRVARPAALVTAGTALFAIASVAPVWAGIETVRRDRPLPPAVQAQLPRDAPLSALCSGREVSGALRARLERGARVLARELRRRPRHVVAFRSFDGGHEGTATVRELAVEQLETVEWAGGRCAGDLERRIAGAL